MEESNLEIGKMAAEAKKRQHDANSFFERAIRKEDYSDIINLPHPISKRHPRMPLSDRAAQFAPFAALSGHDAALQQTERQHESRY